MANFLSRCKKIALLNRINTSLKAKLIVIFAMIATIPISVVGVVSYVKSFSAIQEHTINATTQLAEQVNQNIMLTFQISERFLKIGRNEAVIEFLYADENSEKTIYENAKKIIKVFKIYRDTFEDNTWIKGVYIIGLNGCNICENQGVYKLSKDIESIDTVNKILSAPGKNHIILNQNIDYSTQEAYGNVVSLGTAIVRPVTHELLGVIIVDIDMSSIEELCKDIRIGGTGRFSIVSMEKEPICIFSSDPELTQVELNSICTNMISDNQNGYFIEKINGQKYFYVFNTLSNTGWKIIGKVRLQDLMYRAYSIRVITIIVVMLCIMFTVVMYFFISEKLTLPIVNLKNKMKQAERGIFTVKAECKNKDEIADLCTSFNKMLENINHLIEKNKREQEELSKSELKVMQAQINPHFLYNTLDAIVWLSEAKENESVIQITKALSGFFRTTLSKGREWITIREEIEHISSYLIIQKMRYRDILDYHIDVDEDILNCGILKLMLQPIIENALYHGIKNKKSCGSIIVKGSKRNSEGILLEVIDNGNGMTDERLREVIENLNGELRNPPKNESFGLRNVNQRIKLYYGKQYGLNIKSEFAKGTYVSIIIPEER